MLNTYHLEFYINDFIVDNKRGTQRLLNINAFSFFMKKIIQNTYLWVAFHPTDEKYNKGICNLQNHIKFHLSRSGKNYILKIAVPDCNIRLLEN